MMSYDKYERGRQHLNGGHQRITYKRKKEKIENKNKNKNKNNTYPTAYPKSSMGRGRPCRLIYIYIYVYVHICISYKSYICNLLSFSQIPNICAYKILYIHTY